jgi:glycerophosphoryl diester phosphodiesterase
MIHSFVIIVLEYSKYNIINVRKQGDQNTLQLLLQKLNNYHNNIKLTLEIGGVSTDFLDLNITINKEKLELNIYRKSTASDATIEGQSFHPYSHKNAAYLQYL